MRKILRKIPVLPPEASICLWWRFLYIKGNHLGVLLLLRLMANGGVTFFSSGLNLVILLNQKFSCLG